MNECVPPEVSESNEVFRYWVSPDEISRAARQAGVAKAADPYVQAFGCKNENNQGEFTINRRLLVSVQELIFPGKNKEEINDKWIYVIRDNKYVAEVHALTPKKWRVLVNPDHQTPNDQRANFQTLTAPFIELDPGPVGTPYHYGFFLSPIRMTPKGLDFFLKERARTPKITVNHSFTVLFETVLVPDPFRWAADAHRLYFYPSLTAWQSWIQDRETQSKLFVATTLKSWIDGGDPAGVRNELRTGEPDRFLNQYKKDEKQHRRSAEKAAAYVCQHVDSKEHHAVEISAMEAGGQSLSVAFQAWSCVLLNLIETAPGRLFALGLTGNKNRLPYQYLFAEKLPQNQLDFSHYRHAWLAALGIFSEIVPALATRLKSADDLQKALDNFIRIAKIEAWTNKHKVLRTASNYLKKLRSLPAEAGKILARIPNLNWYEFTSFYEVRNTPSQKNALIPPARLAEIGESFDKLHKNFEQTFKDLCYPIGAVFEIINLVSALKQYADASQGSKKDALWSAMGAGGDFTAFLADTVAEFMKEGLGKRIAGSLAGFAGLVAGVCEMREHELSMLKAGVGQNDYGQAVGHGFAAAGAATTAVGGGMVLAYYASSGLLFGPLGLIVGSLGALILISGRLLARALKLNEYEIFGKSCFLGKDHNTEPRYYDWAIHPFPTRSIARETDVLLPLLCAFRVSYNKWQTWDCIEIEPGYLPVGAIFEVEVDNLWHKAGRLRSRLEVRIDSCTILAVKGVKLKKGGGFQRDSQQRITKITVLTEHEYDGLPGSYISFKSRVRLRVDPHSWPLSMPKNLGWVEIDMLKDLHLTVSSLDSSHIIKDA